MTSYPCYDLIPIPGHTHCYNKPRSLRNITASLIGRPHSSGTVLSSAFTVLCTFSFSLPFVVHYICPVFLMDQVSSDIPTPHASLWLFLHTLDLISLKTHCMLCHPLLLPFLRSFRRAFVPLIPATDLGNQIPTHEFILAHPCHLYSLSGDGTLISRSPGLRLRHPSSFFQTTLAGVIYWTWKLPSNPRPEV